MRMTEEEAKRVVDALPNLIIKVVDNYFYNTTSLGHAGVRVAKRELLDALLRLPEGDAS